MEAIDDGFRYRLQQLDGIVRELASKGGGGVGDDPAWILDYVYRLEEVSEALRRIATADGEGNPSHRSYP